jgi:hypothetical protein
MALGKIRHLLRPLAGTVPNQDEAANVFLQPHTGAPTGLIWEVAFYDVMAGSFLLNQASQRGSQQETADDAHQARLPHLSSSSAEPPGR